MILKFINTILIVSVVLGLSVVGTTVAQQESWQKIAPVGESFTILMPTQAVEASRRIPLNDQDSLRERVYSSLAAGKRYMVVAFMKTSPDKLLALSSFDNFMRSLEQSFRSAPGEIKKSMMFDRDLSGESGIVRQYHLKVGDYSGVARFLGTEKAFYALIVIGAEEADSEAQRFLSSFIIGEPNTSNQVSGVIVDVPTNSDVFERISSGVPPEPWPKTAGPIIGGVLNGKAISLSVPKYPKEARKFHDSGQVTVQVLIDERGVVISAKAIEGPDSLREAAVSAALQSRFTPTRLIGQPVKVNGVIIYNFVAR